MAIELTPQGAVPAIGIPNSQDTARLVFSAPYFDTVPIAEIILPSVEEAVQAILPSLVPPYVDQAAQAAVQQSAVLLTGSTMSGPLNLSPLLPVSDSMAATKAYVDTMVATAGVPEVPAVPVGQSWVRQVGQWAPLATSPGGPFLQLSGGSMQGQINMSGNAILNLPAVPVMPNGAAPATWVLNQIASVSLYQGTWNLDTMTPDLTQASTHINGYTWIAITANVSGVVIGPAVPGLQGQTVYNGDTVIFSAAQGNFSAIHAGGLSAPEADARYIMLTGGQMSGALLLNANAAQPLQAVTLQQLNAFVPPGVVPEAPTTGQLYGRNGLTKVWTPVLPIAGGVLSGALSLSGNASSNLHAVPFQQLNTAIATAVSGYVALGGATMTGLLVLSGNAAASLNPVPLQQVSAMLNTTVLKAGDTMTGPLRISANTATLAALSPPTMLNLMGADGGGTTLTIDAYGAGNPTLLQRKANGTAALPTVTVNNDTLSFIGSAGYSAAGFGGSRTSLSSQASQNWSDTVQGARMLFAVTPNGTTSRTTAMMLENDGSLIVSPGNVGIGAPPGDKLDVRGNVKVASGASDGVIAFGDAALVATASGVYVGRNINGDGASVLTLGGFNGIVFRTADTPATAAAPTARVAIDSGGNFTVNGAANIVNAGGKMALGVAAPGVNRLTVAGQSAAGGQVVEVRSGPNGADSTTVMIHFTDLGNTTQVGTIARTGTNTVVYTTTSDARLKDNIVISERGLDAVLAIRVCDYNMGATRQQGLLAQEVVEHYPEAVVEGGDDPAMQPWSLDYGRLTPLLIRSIQQLTERVAALEAKIP